MQAARKPGSDPWKTVQEAKRKVVVIQKDVIVRTSAATHGHGHEAGTLRYVPAAGAFDCLITVRQASSKRVYADPCDARL